VTSTLEPVDSMNPRPAVSNVTARTPRLINPMSPGDDHDCGWASSRTSISKSLTSGPVIAGLPSPGGSTAIVITVYLARCSTDADHIRGRTSVQTAGAVRGSVTTLRR
jgi:hypothetical protein